ncbi:PPOX class F420-dependent oxidoreductase [Pseudonocardia acaciae]|uniref:PPOX class F420-dependent oxidoreductase n=1 Tax=Pseudonocardia acaciae TaxID=551276 RepID=UPI00048F72E5|nr:PPOX class F420-dependent oxidoreductase [Pseudonocardia acaciae]
MTVSLTAAARELVDGTNFATIATLNADGSPHNSVVWVARDGDAVLFTTTKARRKARNLAGDPRVSLSIYAVDNPYSYVEIRGVAEVTEDEDLSFQRAVSHKYTGQDPPPEPADTVRLTVRITPTKVVEFVAAPPG